MACGRVEAGGYSTLTFLKARQGKACDGPTEAWRTVGWQRQSQDSPRLALSSPAPDAGRCRAPRPPQPPTTTFRSLISPTLRPIKSYATPVPIYTNMLLNTKHSETDDYEMDIFKLVENIEYINVILIETLF